MTERDFPADLHAPAAARSFATQVLATTISAPVPTVLCDDVELVVSELVTNAVRAGCGSVRVEVRVVDAEPAEPRVRVAVRVTDDAEGWPQQRDAPITDVGGRGLALVSAVAETWGVRMSDATKTVWAELTAAQ